jgi:DNA-binding NarL/FixJ family response regulator
VVRLRFDSVGRLAESTVVARAIVMARLSVPFTRREHEIAILVARGLTNREIAEAVSLSARTIEGHIYRASCKVGVATRSELAAVVRDLGDRHCDAAQTK